MDEIIKRRSEITVLLNEMRDKPEKFDQDEFDKLMAEDAKLEARQEAFQALEKRNVQINASVNTPVHHDLVLSDNAPIIAGEDRATTKPWKHFGEYLMAIREATNSMGRNVDPRLLPLQASDDDETRAAGTGSNTQVPSEGGFLVGTEMQGGLLEKVNQVSTMMNLCDRYTITAEGVDSIGFDMIDETSRETGSRYGGVRIYHTDQLGQYTESRPKIAQHIFKPQKLTGLWFASDEIMRDARIMGQRVGSLFAKEMDFVIQDDIIRGTGIGMPLGLLNSNALVSTAKETDQTADTILFENFVHMRGNLVISSRANAQWFLNSEVEEALTLMGLIVGAGGAPVFLPDGSAASVPYNTLLGMPINLLEQNSAIGDVGDVILADMSQYPLVDLGGVDEASSIHFKFDYGQQAFRWTYRIYGAPQWAESVTPYKATSGKKVSPFVTLDERA